MRINNLHENFYFQWVQLIDFILKGWKFVIEKNYENAVNVIIHVHQFRLILTLITLDQLISNKIYSLLTSKV